MDVSPWLLPLIVALVGVLGVGVGGWLAARSTLRVRLIDMLQDSAREHREFQARVVAAINELGTALAHVIAKRRQVLQRLLVEARAKAAASKDGGTVSIDPLELSPEEDTRVVRATERWRAVMAEGHTYASQEAGEAMQAADIRRSELVEAVNASFTHSDILDAIEALDEAGKICDDFREHYARQVYRHLQIEKVAGEARIFQLAKVRRLRKMANDLTALFEGQIADGRLLVSEADRVRGAGE